MVDEARDVSKYENSPWTINPGSATANKLEYLPFGSGRRMCAGLPLAEKMMIYVLASFLHSFEWRLLADAKLDLQDKFGIVTKKMTPLIVIPTLRLSKLELYA
ncbi:hypothetical protein L3X38_028018 [Prunus dulcis]|uniref:Uncharacterized protein n=1 Tax=Prunus dulcis TaxID=3755 RepID=A0AAD4VRA4_PRUDU|nr:hypothetical protein L3X38_028018 [Prunus dulcis]